MRTEIDVPAQRHARSRTPMAFVFALAGMLTLVGCPKGGGKGYTEADLASNPAANFQRGLSVLQSPDRKTGQVDYQTAYSFFNAAVNLGGGPKAAFNAGWTAEMLGRNDDAEKHYRTAYEADTSYERAMYSLARVLTEQGRAAEAVSLYAGHAEKHPDDLEVRNDYAAALIKAGQYDKAITESQDILRKDPKNATVYRNLSTLYYSQNNLSMSQLTAEKALQLNDGDPGVYNNMGVTYLLQGDEAAAIEKFKTAIQVDGSNFEANMNLGFVALNSGDYQLALACFQAANGTNPSSVDARLGLAVALRGTGDFKGAAALYDGIIASDPKNTAAYFNAATLHESYTKDFNKALKYLTAFKDAHAGQISPTHEVFAAMQRVEQARAAEEARKAQEAERKRLEEERRKRNEELLKNMATLITNTQAKLAKLTGCLDEGSVEEISMMLEQAQMVVDAKDTDMAADIQTLLDGYVPLVDEAEAACAGAAPEGDEGDEPAEPVDEAAPEE